MRLLLLCLCLTGLKAFEPAPVFQYRVQTIAGAKPAYAYLWLPASASRVRGLLVCPTTDAEFTLVRHETMRNACREASLGIVWFFGGMGSFYDERGDPLPSEAVTALPAPEDADRRQVIDLALTALAEQSGYAEIATVPWFVFGHSTGALFARNVAYWRPERVFGLAYFKAGTLLRSPGAGWQATVPAEQQAVVDRLQGVPVWGINGEYEEFGPGPYDDVPGARPKEDGTPWTSAADMLRQELLRLRQAGSPAGQLIDPGAGHHALNDGVITTLGSLLADLAAIRLPSDGAEQPIDMLPISPDMGYLVDSQVEDPSHATSTANSYDGDPATAWWFPAAETAERVDQLHVDLRAGAHHFLDFSTPAAEGWAGTSDPEDDGVGFAFQFGNVVEHPVLGAGFLRLQAHYRTNEPPRFFNIDRLAPDNQAWGFSDAPFYFRSNVYAAWKLSATDAYDSGSGYRTASFEARRDGWGVGWQNLPGATRKVHAVAPEANVDGTAYRRSERTIEFKKYIPKGDPQHLVGLDASDPQVFPLDDRPADADDQALDHSFTSGLPPVHYVAYGPAQVIRDADEREFLHITEIPTGAPYPIRVEVVAYQWGKDGAYAPAEATGSFLITAPIDEPPVDGRYCDLQIADSVAGISTQIIARQTATVIYDDSAVDHRIGPSDPQIDLQIEMATTAPALDGDG